MQRPTGKALGDQRSFPTPQVMPGGYLSTPSQLVTQPLWGLFLRPRAPRAGLSHGSSLRGSSSSVGRPHGE